MNQLGCLPVDESNIYTTRMACLPVDESNVCATRFACLPFDESDFYATRLASPSANESKFYATRLASLPVEKLSVDLTQAWADYAQFGQVTLDPSPIYYRAGRASNVWDPQQPLNSTISVSIDSELPTLMWHRNAWNQLKAAVQKYSPFDDAGVDLDTNAALRVACEYISTSIGDIFPTSVGTIVSTAEILGFMEPIAKKIRNVFIRLFKATALLYGGRVFLVADCQMVATVTAARQHTTHLEAVDLARSHSALEPMQKEVSGLICRSAEACRTFFSMCWEQFSRRILPTLYVCASAVSGPTT